MKAIRFFFLMAAVISSVLVKADELTTEQKAFRTSIMTFLKEEGFSPYIDDENSLCFKREGVLFWINVGDGSPFYVELIRSGFNTEDANADAILKACNEVNRKKKCVKAIKFDTSVGLAIESFCHSAESFKYVFYKGIGVLNSAHDDFEKYYDEFNGGSATSLPFTFSSASIGITNSEGTIITEFGSSLYSSKTKYLSPKIYLNGITPGTYTIYIKMYMPSGELSTGTGSPSGYSYSETLSVKSGLNSYIVKGWGSNNAGHWASGNYRFEFYYNGIKFGEKAFMIY